MIKKFISVMTAATIAGVSVPVISVGTDKNNDIFFDDFTGGSLDTDKWLIAEKNWGGTIKVDGETVDYNGGVVRENVAVSGGNLILTGLGDQYEGPVCGINRNKTRRDNGKRCGGAIATKEYFSSGSYEMRAKIAPILGCCSSMWTFEYEEDYSNGLKITNHEIDIEFPGRDSNGDFSLSHALLTTWIGENEGEYKTESAYCGDQTDGEFHTYRFDWHTGSDTEIPRVEYYFDDVLTYTSYDFIPTNAGRLWLGLWFPKYWAGTPDFDTTEFVVDYIKITPFHESGDTPQNESYPDDGWAEIPETILGDVNGDGKFNIADLVLFNKWLLAVPGTELKNGEAGDLCEDGRLDIFDLCLMRKLLINSAVDPVPEAMMKNNGEPV